VLEEASGVLRGQRVERSTHRFQQGFASAPLGLAQQRLELGERFLYLWG
jgi:hypothetical protein